MTDHRSTPYLNVMVKAAGEKTERNLRLHSLAVFEVALRHGLSQWVGRQVPQSGPSVPCWQRQIIDVPVAVTLPLSMQ